MYTYTKRIYTNQALHYVVNAECIARYTIMLFIFIKVDISQINNFKGENIELYRIGTVNLHKQNATFEGITFFRYY